MGTSTVGLNSEGSVYMWGSGGLAGGSNINGGSGVGLGFGLHDHRINMFPQLVPHMPIGLGTKVVDIACGLGHVLFLMKNGHVYSSGTGTNGRLGLGDSHDRRVPTLITGKIKIGVEFVCIGW